jgi:hypothetical protein
MYQRECIKEGIELKFYQDNSLVRNGAQWVMMDPSRALQVISYMCCIFLDNVNLEIGTHQRSNKCNQIYSH